MKAMPRGEMPTQAGYYWFRPVNAKKAWWRITSVMMTKSREPFCFDLAMDGEDMSDYQWAGPIPYPCE